MAIFLGNIEDFTKFIGPYARNKVMHITSNYKRQKGMCEDCGSTSKGLEAAHVKGSERPLIIGNILSEFIGDDGLMIDLDEFEEKYIAAHQPIEKTIRILCKECHRLYDSSRQLDSTVAINNIESGINNVFNEQVEGQAIEKLVVNSMNKAKAMRLAYNYNLNSLIRDNTTFSNINNSYNHWWLQPDNDKFKTDHYFILHNQRSRTLYYFKIPSGTVTNPSNYFKQRDDDYRKNCSNIYIPVSTTTFIEKGGFDFTSYLIEKVEY